MANRLDIVAETGSTNADLVARLSAGEELPEGYWLIADRQTGGRGRHGRSWLDAPGNFMGSTLVRAREGDPPLPSLSFVASLAVYAATAANIANPSALQLKWPNDVLLAGAKFCGILLEKTRDAAVIGIGVNLKAAPGIEGRRIAALSEIGAAPDRDLFAQHLADTFDKELQIWRRDGIAPLLSRWQVAAHPPGTQITVHPGGSERLAGTYEGLEADGALRLRLADGTPRVIHAGDVMLESD